GETLLWSAVLGVSYLALEPYVRRRWPWRVISWNRVLEGRWRDPLVGRDVLIGLVWGVIAASLSQAEALLPALWGGGPVVLSPLPPLGFQPLVGLLRALTLALYQALLWFFLFFLCFVVVRREALATPLVIGLAAL